MTATKCRKSLGAFIAAFIIAPIPQLTWISKSTYKEYASSERGRRGFCENCGGGISWRDINDESKIELTAALVDEEILHNKEIGLLTGGTKGVWCKNILKGLDDGVQLTTVKYLEGMEG